MRHKIEYHLIEVEAYFAIAAITALIVFIIVMTFHEWDNKLH